MKLQQSYFCFLYFAKVDGLDSFIMKQQQTTKLFSFLWHFKIESCFISTAAGAQIGGFPFMRLSREYSAAASLDIKLTWIQVHKYS